MVKKIAIIGSIGIAIAAILYWPSAKDEQTAGGALADVAVPNLSEKAIVGQVVFVENCAVCHGENAAGRDGLAPPLIHKIYEPSHHGDQSFYLAAKNGVRAHHWPFGNMPPVEGISDEAIADITYYIRELQRANGIN